MCIKESMKAVRKILSISDFVAVRVGPKQKDSRYKRRKWKRKVCVALAAVSTMSFVLTGCGQMDEKEITGPRSGMFEWNEERIYQTDRIGELLRVLPITDWYQETAVPVGQEDMEAFLTFMNEENVRVYAMAGETQWGYEEDGASLISWLEEIISYNRKAGKGKSFRGVMLDVEPYVLKKWKEDPEVHMETYVKGMKEAYGYAKENNLDVIVCIPRHYDDQGLTGQLEELIAEACDEVAVMNYDCGFEAEKIETEALLAQKYGKSLHCILEFQEVGKHGLVEQKTYRNKGVEAAWEAWDLVDQAYPEMQITRDYHWSSPIFQMIKEEGKTVE